MNFWHTDKVEPHGYFQSYARIAAELGPKAKVCELGVQGGYSLSMFQGLFPLGKIIGVDQERNSVWPQGTVKVVMSQDDPRLPAELAEIDDRPFGLIVDDCSHDGTLTRKSWEILWPLVQPGGYYVIEDWSVALRSDPHWGACWGPSMLRTAESFLPMLSYRDAEVDEITYRYGLIIIHRSSE